MGLKAHRLPLGERVGRWLILERLGRGAAASVYRARDTSGRNVALKVLHADPHEEATHSVDRMRREIRLAQRVDDPGVCRIFELEPLDDLLVLVMEYIPGRSLRALLEDEGSLAPSRAVRIIRKVAKGIAAAHAHLILHRDLKPGNVMVRPDDSTAVLDFGYAVAPDVTRVTQKGAWVGTLAYAAPELLKNEPASHASDIYSLGVMLYECLAGDLPFLGHNYGELASAILFRDPLPPSRHQPRLDPRLDAVVMRAMSREPDERFTSAAELAGALAELSADLSCEEPTLTAVSPIQDPRGVAEEPTLPARKPIPARSQDGGGRGPPAALADLPTAVEKSPLLEDTEPDLEGTRSKANARKEPGDAAAVIPTPQGARDRLAVHKKLADLSAALMRERQAKGIILGDNKELDSLERKAEQALSQGNWSDTTRCLELALERARAIEVDKHFLLAKAQRFATAISEKDQRQNLAHFHSLLERARTALERGDLDGTNKVLNHGFDTLRAR